MMYIIISITQSTQLNQGCTLTISWTYKGSPSFLIKQGRLGDVVLTSVPPKNTKSTILDKNDDTNEQNK